MSIPPEPSERAPLIHLIVALSEEMARLASDDDLLAVLQAALDGAHARLALIMPHAPGET